MFLGGWQVQLTGRHWWERKVNQENCWEKKLSRDDGDGDDKLVAG